MDATQKITKNLGGERLGSGSKNNISLHAYNRSTHDLSRAWRSTMNCGTLVPFFVEPSLPGDTWSIDLETLVRTIPTIGPLYGSYKLQLDVFECPIRLYNGLLHNNMTKIGLNMAQVKLPKVKLQTSIKNPNRNNYEINQSQIASDALLNYLGIAGVGDIEFSNVDPDRPKSVVRRFNGIPLLAYWDIYKNYYANKQEEKGVFIDVDLTEDDIIMHECLMNGEICDIEEPTSPPTTITNDTYQACQLPITTSMNGMLYVPENFTFAGLCVIGQDTSDNWHEIPITTLWPNGTWNEEHTEFTTGATAAAYATYVFTGFTYNMNTIYENNIKLSDFDLQNIDNARIAILRDTGLGNELLVNDLETPYKEITSSTNDGSLKQKYSQHGLGIKTYQSDIFNNWLQTEWLDGVNGINQITAIDVSSGSFTIDALNLANKVYNMLNRIAVSGGSYEDYIESVYTIETMRRAESPVYKGGMSAEIMFQEVVSTSATDDDPLGTLAGKGTQGNKRGGHIEIKTDEPGFIMGIVSLTPRIDYSQGNKWWATELDTLDDLHKPALDAIGFQDLLQERMAWWGTYYDEQDKKWIKLANGKVPAWIDYMTSYNETHGEFAEENKKMFMTLNRRYEYAPRVAGAGMGIYDPTTYINPTKYNYTFAEKRLSAQNFWVQIGIKAIARRVMSAKVIPNL